MLCPIDFSTPSRAALRYAVAIAEHYGSRLTVMTVADPLLAEAAAIQGGADWLVNDCDRELRRFVDQTMDHRSAFALEVEVRGRRRASPRRRFSRRWRAATAIWS